jgi:hypothetical protein
LPPRWNYLNLGKDESWSQSLHAYLLKIPSQYVLLFVDYTALTASPEELSIIVVVLELMKVNKAVMCRMGSYPKPDKMINKLIGRMNEAAGMPYITSWTKVIWNKEFGSR